MLLLRRLRGTSLLARFATVSLLMTIAGGVALSSLLGAGIEHAFAGTGLSAKLEYDYIDYGSRDYNFPLAVIVPIDIGSKIREYQHVVKIGVNYRFGSY